MLAYVLSFIDRQILSLLVMPIRRDLQISDTQMSLLTGFSFAIFYTVCGIPLGRLADSRSRRGLVAAGVLVWSLMTAVCGMARSYGQFLFGRIGVGVGEAALSPAAYSLIADSFPEERRATAISVYSMGIYLGSGLAYLLGGMVITLVSREAEMTLPYLGAMRPWQLIFILLGVVGVFFSLLLLLVREPARQGGFVASMPVADVWHYMRKNRRCVLYHNLGFASISFATYGSAAWIPSFFARTHGWTAAQAGIVYGGLVMLLGCLGVVCGGRWADRMSRKNRSDANMRVGLYAALASLPFMAAFPLVDDSRVAVLLLAPTVFLLSMPFGVAAAAIQEIMPNPMRGQASACYLFVVNLIGLGLGPTAIALLTDFAFADDQALRYSMAIACSAGVGIAVLLLGRGLHPYRESRKYLQQWLATSER